nr:THUMP domain-containing protein [Achromobacter aestuarii]
MTTDDSDSPRKTLTAKRDPATDAPADAPKRTRSGARARLVAQTERSRQQTQRMAATELPPKPAAGENAGDEPAKPAVVHRPAPPPRESRFGRDDARSDRPARSPRPDGGSRFERPDGRAAGPRGDRPERSASDRSSADRGSAGRSSPQRGASDRGADRYDRGGRPNDVDRSNRAEGRDRPARENERSSDERPRSRNASVPNDDRDLSANAASRFAVQVPEVERFGIFASCPQGLEDALAAEMQALGFEDATPGRAGCQFSADWEGVQRANLYSRLATRILVRVAQAPISTEDDILELARATPWERWFGAEHTLRVDTSAIRSPMQSLQYCNLRAKDGICDRLRELEGERPSIDTVRPDARVHLFLTADTATLYLDTSGESLFKRGWRLDKGEAPLRENLAAGMLALAGWDPSAPLLDPFCGSGTILIEAAWIALGIPPGIARPLGFERLRGHDAAKWQAVKDEAESRIQSHLETPLIGYDIDPQVIEFARNNMERAWLADEAIRFEVGDARHIEAPAPSGWIVTNPPYGDRLPLEDDTLLPEWASCLKRNFDGWQLHAISSDMSFPQALRLKAARRTPLFNGGLDCRLFGFDIKSGDFRNT